MPAFKNNQGSWRPDYLLQKDISSDGTATMAPRMCEINARFPWNAVMAVPILGQAYMNMGASTGGLKPGMDWEVSNTRNVSTYFDE